MCSLGGPAVQRSPGCCSPPQARLHRALCGARPCPERLPHSPQVGSRASEPSPGSCSRPSAVRKGRASHRAHPVWSPAPAEANSGPTWLQASSRCSCPSWGALIQQASNPVLSKGSSGAPMPGRPPQRGQVPGSSHKRANLRAAATVWLRQAYRRKEGPRRKAKQQSPGPFTFQPVEA